MKTHWPSWGGGILLLGLAFAGGWLARGGSERGGTAPDSASNAGRTGLPARTASGARSGLSSRSGTTGNARGANRWESPEALEAAFREAFSITDDREREARFYDMLLDLDIAQFPRVVDLIRENDRRGTGSGAEWEMLWQRWGKTDATKALDYLRKVDGTDWYPEALGAAAFHAIRGWASEAPVAAAEGIEGARDLDGGLDAAFVIGAAGTDPEFATRWILERGDEKGNPRQLLDIVADKLAKTGGLLAVEKWYRDLLTNESATMQGRSSALDIVVERMSRNGFPEAGEWLLREEAAPENDDVNKLWRAAHNLASNYAQREQEAAAEWALTLDGKSHLSSSMISSVFGRWVRTDTDAAGTWLGQHQGQPGYDEAAFTFAKEIAQKDPVSAKAWAETIRDAGIRRRTTSLLEMIEKQGAPQ